MHAGASCVELFTFVQVHQEQGFVHNDGQNELFWGPGKSTYRGEGI
jgi:hypothetical protein